MILERLSPITDIFCFHTLTPATCQQHGFLHPPMQFGDTLQRHFAPPSRGWRTFDNWNQSPPRVRASSLGRSSLCNPHKQTRAFTHAAHTHALSPPPPPNTRAHQVTCFHAAAAASIGTMSPWGAFTHGGVGGGGCRAVDKKSGANAGWKAISSRARGDDENMAPVNSVSSTNPSERALCRARATPQQN